MQNQNRSSFFVPPHPDVPEETHHKVLTHLTAEHQARAKRLIKRSQRVAAVNAQYREQVEDLLGKGKYEQLRQYLAEALARQSRQLAPPKGLELSREDIEQLAARRREEGEDFLRKLGTKPEALSALSRRFQLRMQKGARQPEERKDNQGKAVDVKDVPAAIRKHKTNPWTFKYPPFDGSNTFLWISESAQLQYMSGTSHEQSGHGGDYTNPETGAVGSMFTVGSQNIFPLSADTYTSHVEQYSSVGIWYQMDEARTPEAARKDGKVEVWVEAQAFAARHRISLYRELGWASAWVDQNNYITLRATGEGDPGGPMLDIESRALVSRMVEDGPNNVDWNTSYIDCGPSVWTHHFSANVFPANRWIWVQIGTESVMDVSVNDVEVDSVMDFRWLIKSVQLRSSGDTDD